MQYPKIIVTVILRYWGESKIKASFTFDSTQKITVFSAVSTAFFKNFAKAA